MSGTARRENPQKPSNREGPPNPARDSTPKSSQKPDAFLELKGMIQQMHGQFQQEIASLKANMLHHVSHKAVNPYQHMMYSNMMPLGQSTLQSSL